MRISITDRTDFVAGLENDGGCYIYYTTIERVGNRWLRTDSSSCEFAEVVGPWEIDCNEVKALVASAKLDNNCTVKFSR